MDLRLPSVLALGLATSSCSPTSDNPYLVRGVVQHVLVPSPFQGSTNKAARTIDSVVAYPMEKARIAPSGLLEMTTSLLDANGEFALSLRRDRDYMLVLVD